MSIILTSRVNNFSRKWGKGEVNVGRQLPASFRKYFEMNRIFSVALVYCNKMSTIASLGIRMLCGQPVFLILKSRKSYFRCNSVLSSDYYRYEIYDFQTMINPILEMAIQKLELWNLKSEFRNQKSEIRIQNSENRNRKSQSLKIWNPQLRNQKSKAWFPKCHSWYPILTITVYQSGCFAANPISKIRNQKSVLSLSAFLILVYRNQPTGFSFLKI